MAERDTIDVVIEELAKALAPLRQAVSSADTFTCFAAQLGWSVDDVPPPLQGVIGPLDDLIDALGPIVAGRDPSLLEYDVLRQAITAVVTAIDALESASYDPALAAEGFATTFPRQLTQFLIVRYLLDQRPALAFVLRVFGLLRIRYVPRSGARLDHTQWELAWPDFTELLRDPAIVFRRAAAWGTAEFAAYEVLESVQDLMTSIGAPSVLEELDARVARILENQIDLPRDPVRWYLRIPLFSRASENGVVAAGIGLFPLPPDGALLPGLALLPYADASIAERFEITDGLFLTIDGTFDLMRGVGMLVRPDRAVEVVAELIDGSPAAVTGALSIRLDQEEEEARRLIALRNGSRVEFARLSSVGGLRLAGEQWELFAEIELHGVRLVIAHGAGDSFLQSVTPPDDLAVQFDLALGLSTARGLYFRGSSVLEKEVPTHFSVGPIEVQSISVAVRPEGDGIPILVGASIATHLGPIIATVTGIGLRARLAFPGSGGNLGPLDVDLDFKPPDGMGLLVEAGPITGGGFLSYDAATGRYSGVLDLHAREIGITAMGLLDTRLPPGQGGYALLVALRATFPAIQIGFGFALTSVGGLLALNRRVDVDALRAQLAAGTAGRILAPEDPIRNAPALLADLSTVFPIAPGVTVVGPTAQLVWARLVQFDIGVFIELPGPSRIVLLGSARAAIEGAGRTYLVIRVDIVGVVDLPQRIAAFDAVLIGSQLLEILDLTGGAAFRLSWGAQPYALLTLGGFHPAYNPEPLVLPPTLTRIAMVHGTPEDRLYLRFEGYFAVTSNTLQFGAAVQAIVRSGNFNIQGMVLFDALIRFQPFHFRIDIRASVRVRYRSRTLAGLTLTGSLEGPGPIVLRAKVCIELLFFDICFSQTFTLGSSAPPPVTTIGSALSVFLAELDDPATLYASGTTDRFVTLRPPPPQETRPIVSPVGQLVWVQRQAPLGVLLQRIGGAPVGAPQTVDATSADGTAPELDWFAPGLFADLTDDQALTRRGFERLTGGLRFGVAGSIDGPAEQRTLHIRQIRLPAREESTPTPTATAFPLWVVSAASRARGARPTSEPIVGAMTVTEERWAVVDVATGETRDVVSGAQAHQLAVLGAVRGSRVAIFAGDRLASLVF